MALGGRILALGLLKLVLVGLVLGAIYFGASADSAVSALATAYQNQQSNVQVQGSGRVTKVLADDNDRSRHQRFIVRRASGQTVLIEGRRRPLDASRPRAPSRGRLDQAQRPHVSMMTNS